MLRTIGLEFRFLLTVMFVLAIAPRGAQATSIHFSLPGSLEPLETFFVQAGQTERLAIVVTDVPSMGLAAFQFDLSWDPNIVFVLNPNEAFQGSTDPFAPLGANPFCTVVRGTASCEDPIWFLTSTGRSAVGTDEINNTLGKLLLAYATSGETAPPSGGGTIALIDILATTAGATTMDFSNVLLADNSEPPTSYPSTSISLMIVPEPGTVVLVAVGLLVLGARGRRSPAG